MVEGLKIETLTDTAGVFMDRPTPVGLFRSLGVLGYKEPGAA
ncbi:hypothetical protein ACRYCC_30860 [Actinomadura scrupuli]